MPRNIGKPVPVTPATTPHEDGAQREGRKQVTVTESRYIGSTLRRRQGIGTRLVTMTFSASYTPGTAKAVSFYPMTQTPTNVELKRVTPLGGGTPTVAVYPANTSSWTVSTIYVQSNTANITIDLLVT